MGPWTETNSRNVYPVTSLTHGFPVLHCLSKKCPDGGGALKDPMHVRCSFISLILDVPLRGHSTRIPSAASIYKEEKKEGHTYASLFQRGYHHHRTTEYEAHHGTSLPQSMVFDVLVSRL